MLTKKEKIFSSMFVVILIAELVCGTINSLSTLHYVTKPAIVMSLIMFFWKDSKSVAKPIRILTLLALMCSLLGDVLLLFVDASPDYFMLGLVAFLVAHVMYILVFLKYRNPSKKPFIFLALLLIYAFGLFSILIHGLGDMLGPVLLYMAVILTMSVTAFLRKGRVSKTSYNYVFFGAILFMVSDSLLAIDRFYEALPLATLFIMLTYALAQFFIVLGIKKAS